MLKFVFLCISKNVSVHCEYTKGKCEKVSSFNPTLDDIDEVYGKLKDFQDETVRLNVDAIIIFFFFQAQDGIRD